MIDYPVIIISIESFKLLGKQGRRAYTIFEPSIVCVKMCGNFFSCVLYCMQKRMEIMIKIISLCHRMKICSLYNYVISILHDLDLKSDLLQIVHLSEGDISSFNISAHLIPVTVNS
jgi:hypothetical protein